MTTEWDINNYSTAREAIESFEKFWCNQNHPRFELRRIHFGYHIVETEEVTHELIVAPSPDGKLILRLKKLIDDIDELYLVGLCEQFVGIR